MRIQIRDTLCSVWARVHKIDRIRPLPGGGGIVLVEDERNAAAMNRNIGLSTVIAIARVINARRALEARFGGKGEIRYASAATPPPFLVDAITRAGASISDSRGERVTIPARSAAAVSSIVDHAMAELAHHIRTSHGMTDMAAALTKVENARRKSPLDRDTNPAAYWSAVFEIAALAGELSRARGGRWIEAAETPVPFAVQFPGGEQAVPTRLAQQIVEGRSAEEILAATAAAVAAERAAADAASAAPAAAPLARDPADAGTSVESDADAMVAVDAAPAAPAAAPLARDPADAGTSVESDADAMVAADPVEASDAEATPPRRAT